MLLFNKQCERHVENRSFCQQPAVSGLHLKLLVGLIASFTTSALATKRHFEAAVRARAGCLQVLRGVITPRRIPPRVIKNNVCGNYSNLVKLTKPVCCFETYRIKK